MKLLKPAPTLIKGDVWTGFVVFYPNIVPVSGCVSFHQRLANTLKHIQSSSAYVSMCWYETPEVFIGHLGRKDLRRVMSSTKKHGQFHACCRGGRGLRATVVIPGHNEFWLCQINK